MIYLDFSATTPINEEVLEGYYQLLKKYYANSSSNHCLGREANNFLKQARRQIANLLKVKEDEVYFTSGATESNNIAIIGVALANRRTGKHLITTKIEHHSVLNVFQYLEKEFGFSVTYLNVDQNGIILLDELEQVLTKETTLISIMGVNNEMGSIQPLAKISSLIKSKAPAAVLHVDATQMIGKYSINMDDIDLLSFSAHKIHGLKGSGALIKKENVKIEPIIFGGKQEKGLRPGTLNWQADVILAKTLRIALENLDANYQKVKPLQLYLLQELATIDGVYVNSNQECSPYIINFSLKGIPSEVVVSALEENGYVVSTVSACSLGKAKYSHVIKELKREPFRETSSIRLSLDPSITLDNLNGFIQSLKAIIKHINLGSK